MFNKIITIFLISVFITFFKFSSNGDSVELPAKIEELNGSWIGYTESFVDFLKIELNKDGTGYCSRQFSNKKPKLYLACELTKPTLR